MSKIPPRPLTQRQKDHDAFEAFKDEVWRQNWIEGERLESQQLWAEYVADGGAEALVRDAEVAREESNAVRAARHDRWKSRALAVELDFDPDRLGL
ncbi:hypothetical protein [Synechococcus sp. UW179A]|uniref:hypothetical protein n=1 Tax=Synechococcus sp. UW179A TaxID=2575510 RepID=UPI000E0FBEF5|nr:hypothetical protein [Synechococcus sp. UW179A]